MLQSGPSKDGATQGSIYVNGAWECYSLEDEVREIVGQPVSEWKVPGKTAIPAGHYRITFEDSSRFGKDTLTVNDVPGFAFIRIHGGNTVNDTEGCVLVGDSLDWDKGRISGAAVDHVLEKLKAQVRIAMNMVEEVWMDVRRT